MKKITVFTPTYNRSHTLPRVYRSLLNQTCKNFVWLIIDDGSTDSTKKIVEEWINEKMLTIEYHHKIHGGKHTAMSLAWEKTKTKYLIEVDSDDELVDDAVEVFDSEWKKIEESKLEDLIGEVSGLTFKENEKLVGNYNFKEDLKYVDSSWQEMVFKFGNYNEQCSCWNVQKLKECVLIPEHFWLAEKVSCLAEGIFWARFGRIYKTRYLNRCVRIYHEDAGDSVMRMTDKTKAHYNNLVGQKYFLDENLDCFWQSPRFFINPILKFIVSGIELGFPPFYLLHNIATLRFKMAYCVLWPVGVAAWLYFRYIKRHFWL